MGRRKQSSQILADVTIARTALELIAISTGLNYKLVRHRAHPISLLRAQRWSEVWEQVSASRTV
jgi:hypothetical protein